MHMGYSFGDIRLDRRGDLMTEQIVATGSLVLRRFGGGRDGELAAGRFLASGKVTPEAIIDIHATRTAAAAQGRRIVAVQDTTEVNFSGRDRSRKGLGCGGDGKSLGFFIHAAVAVDADSEQLLGVLDAQIWTRALGKRKRRQMRTVEEKETMRWIRAMQAVHVRLLRAAAKRIHITDREGDFYPLLARVPEGDDVVIRARHNRKMPAGGTLFEQADAWPDLGESEIVVPPRGPGDKSRKARVALRARRVRLAKPAAKVRTPDPDEIEIGLVEVREIDPPAGVKGVHWRLLTTLPTATREDAADVVRLYRLRWRIEQVFRALKSDGLALEETQVEEAGRLFNLAALGLTAAVRILQLVDARDGSDRPASDVLDAELIEPAAAIGKTLQGKTKRQQNPHAKGTLGWLSWIAARLGGWNCYYKKPGPKTMALGWRQLAAMISGFVIANSALAAYGTDV
jgi:DDE family transposase